MPIVRLESSAKPLKRIALRALLAQHDICHPTRFTGCTVKPRELRLTFKGCAWWLDKTASRAEGEITFIFVNPSLGHLHMSMFDALGDQETDEVLEDFTIVQNEKGDWTDFNNISVYGQSPLHDPLTLFAHLHDYLAQMGSYKSPREFLNCPPGKLKRFAEITDSSLYLLSQAPEEISNFICAQLDEQGVKYYKIEATKEHKPQLIVNWLGCVFECDKAYAEFR